MASFDVPARLDSRLSRPKTFVGISHLRKSAERYFRDNLTEAPFVSEITFLQMMSFVVFCHFQLVPFTVRSKLVELISNVSTLSLLFFLLNWPQSYFLLLFSGFKKQLFSLESN